jgi:hypothetical protein
MGTVLKKAQQAQAEDQAEAIDIDIEVSETPQVCTLTPNAGTVMGQGAHLKVKSPPTVGGPTSNMYGKIIPPGWTLETFHTAAGREETWSPPTKKAAAKAATKGFAKAKKVTPAAEAQEVTPAAEAQE